VTCWRSSEWSLWLPAQGAVLLDPLFTLPEVVLLMLFSTMTVLLGAIRTTALALIGAMEQSTGDVLRGGKVWPVLYLLPAPTAFVLVIGELKWPKTKHRHIRCITVLC
jgi:hypothetical protein